MTTEDYEAFKSVLRKFYFKVIRKHPEQDSLKWQLQVFNDQIKKTAESPKPMMHLGVTQSRGKPHIHHQMSAETDRISLHSANSKSKNQLSQSHASSRSGRTGETGGAKSARIIKTQFGVEWVYESSNRWEVMLFGLISCFMLGGNKMGFSIFQERVRRYFEESGGGGFETEELKTCWRFWKKICQLGKTKNQALRWQRPLKQAMGKLPQRFTEVVMRIYLGKVNEEEGIPVSFVDQLLREGGVTIGYFIISCQELEVCSKDGRYSVEICLGYLRHSKKYVISSRLPSYSEDQTYLRGLKDIVRGHVEELITTFEGNNTSLIRDGQKMNVSRQESQIKSYLSEKIRLLAAL